MVNIDSAVIYTRSGHCMTGIPLLHFETRIVAALATMNQAQAARHFGMDKASFRVQVKAILKRIDSAGGDTTPLRQTIADWHHSTTAFSRLRGRKLEAAKMVIDGNELVGPASR